MHCSGNLEDAWPFGAIARGAHGAILVDPPWRFQTYSAKGEKKSAQSHYQCMNIDKIKRLPVADFAAPDCALFLWATDPLLPKAFDLIQAWGFTYKTVAFYWAKTNPNADLDSLSEKDFFCGLGYWSRANPEPCLLATRGRPPRLAKNVRRLIVAPRREHSRKPEESYTRIERLVPGPYVELFSRSRRPNWQTWGDQEELFDTTSPPKNSRKRQTRDRCVAQFNLQI